MDRARCILLRRPATLSIVDEPFVPDGALEEVDARWDDLRAINPAYYDGRLLHVLGVHRNGHGGAVLHVVECAYRYFAVQNESFDVGVRPLGVKGITVRDGQVLVGRRADHVAAYAGEWEFAPGGAVEPTCTPAEALLRELDEETGVVPAREPTAVALLYDPVTRCWEVVYRIEASGPGATSTEEYDELVWRATDDLPPTLTPVARQMVALL
jgi:8-oxo-dGTP pyrophosphatase MutT (NUDIX family)